MTDSDAADILDANAPDPADAVGPDGPRQADLSGIRAIFFDLDDTLCGYWDASKKGLREAFVAEGPDGFTVEQMVSAWAEAFRSFAPTLKKTDWYAKYLVSGEPTRTEQMRRTLLELGIDDPARVAALSQAYMERRDANLTLFDDAIEVLTALKGRYPLGLITNGPADVQRQEVATCGIGGFFDAYFIEGEMGEGKPVPAVFERARSAGGATPEQTLMVGNSYHHDVVPALKAGWKAVWIRRPSDVPPSATAPEQRPEDGPIPTATIHALRELLPMLQVDGE